MPTAAERAATIKPVEWYVDGHFMGFEEARLQADIEAALLPGQEEALEEAAKVAEGDTSRDDFPWCGDVRDIAAAIRGLESQPLKGG